MATDGERVFHRNVGHGGVGRFGFGQRITGDAGGAGLEQHPGDDAETDDDEEHTEDGAHNLVELERVHAKAPIR